jgi:hypothetical protein
VRNAECALRTSLRIPHSALRTGEGFVHRLVRKPVRFTIDLPAHVLEADAADPCNPYGVIGVSRDFRSAWILQGEVSNETLTAPDRNVCRRASDPTKNECRCPQDGLIL